MPSRSGFSLPHAGLAAALVGGMLFFCTAVTEAYTLPKFGAIALGAWLAWMGLLAAVERDGWTLRRTPLDRPLAALLAVLALSTAFSADRTASLIGQLANFYGLLPLLLCGAVYYAAACSPDSADPKPLLRLCAAAGALLGLYALLQKLGIEPFPGAPADLPGGRAISASGTPPFLGSNILILLPPTLCLALAKDRRDRILGIAAGLLAGAGLILTISRGACLGAGAGCAAYVLLSGRLPLRRVSARSWAAVAMAVLLLSLALAFAVHRLRPPALADSDRVQTWLAGGRIYRHHPVLGSGPDTFRLACHRHRTEGMMRALAVGRSPGNAHNDLVQVAATMGTLGLAAYLWLLWGLIRLFRSSLAEEDRRDTAAALGGALFGLFVAAKFNPVPLSALAAASAWAGLAVPSSDEGDGVSPERSRWIAWTACAACLGLLLLAGKLGLASRHHRLAMRAGSAGRPKQAIAHFEKAVRLNPWELTYKGAYIRFLAKWAPRAGSARQKVVMMERAAALGRDGALRHRNDARAHHMLGLSLWMLRRVGGPDRLEEADRALARGQELNPYHLPLVQVRLQVAREREDKGTVDSLSEEVRRIQGLLPERAKEAWTHGEKL